MTLPPWTIREQSAADLGRALPDLTALLHACVHAGASIGFILPFPREEAEAYWSQLVLPRHRQGGLVVLTAHEGARLVGTVQLDHDTPANQRHRAEVRKLLVHPDCRRRGLAKALMAAIEERARALGRSLVTLDTRTGDAAEPLYAGLGYRTAGAIPGYCRHPFADRLESTTLMYKTL